MTKPLALVIGVGPGLGAAVARRFAKGGFEVLLGARSTDFTTELASKIHDEGGSARPVRIDVSSRQSVTNALADVKDNIEAMVYNAGAFARTSVLDMDPDEFENSIATGALGAFHAVKQVGNGMVKRKKGTIIFTGATASLRSGANFAGLAVGKFSLRALAQSLAREIQPKGVHVAHIIIDGVIDTPGTRSWMKDWNDDKFLKPDEIAETYWNVHMQGKSAWTHELEVRPHVEKW